MRLVPRSTGLLIPYAALWLLAITLIVTHPCGHRDPALYSWKAGNLYPETCFHSIPLPWRQRIRMSGSPFTRPHVGPYHHNPHDTAHPCLACNLVDQTRNVIGG